MRTNNRGNITAQEDDKEKCFDQENMNRGLTECVESSSGQNQNEN